MRHDGIVSVLENGGYFFVHSVIYRVTVHSSAVSFSIIMQLDARSIDANLGRKRNGILHLQEENIPVIGLLFMSLLFCIFLRKTTT